LLAAIVGGLTGFVTIAISTTLALYLGIAAAIVFPIVLWVMSPKIRIAQIDDREVEVHCGPAHIESRYLDAPEILRDDAFNDAVRTHADVRDFVCYSPWVKSAVVADVDDHRDPTPRWIICTRHPEEVHAILRNATVASI